MELEHRQAGPSGVVLVGERGAEDGHQAIAGELVDRPLEGVYRPGGERQEAIEDHTQRSISSERVSFIEPTMSVNITVTCLRSPSISARCERIFAASGSRASPARRALRGTAQSIRGAPASGMGLPDLKGHARPDLVRGPLECLDAPPAFENDERPVAQASRRFCCGSHSRQFSAAAGGYGTSTPVKEFQLAWAPSSAAVAFFRTGTPTVAKPEQ